MAQDGQKNPFDPTAEEDHTVVEMASIPLDSPSARPVSPARRRVKVASPTLDANGKSPPGKGGYESITAFSPAEHSVGSPRSPSLRVRIENETPRKDGEVRSSSGWQPGSSRSQPGSAGRVVSPSHVGSPAHSFKSNGEEPKRKTKFELFELDNLVSALGLRSMAGQMSGDAEESEGLTTGRRRRAVLGTVMGVFVPCLQNIMGIVLFIRLSWIVGMAGIGETLLLTAMCCLCTFITSLSLSAIATNGAMKGGGPYFLIGRALGPEVGVSIGICFFLGNAFAASLYILGGVEVILDAIPGMRIFGTKYTDVNTTISALPTAIVTRSTNLHDMQIYGCIITALLGAAVFGGAKMIARLGPSFLIPVMVSIIFIFIGIVTAPRGDMSPGITGLSWKNFSRNWSTEYQRTNVNGVPDPTGSVTWAFRDMLGLFFPAVTGILAGSNRSSVLKDPQRSIPAGTLSAHLVSTIIYFVSILLFGMVATREYLLSDRLLTATVAWPVPAVVSVGITLSTLGAALQSLTGAPALLAAIANDEILPIFNFIKSKEASEPYRAICITLLLCALCCLIGNLDLITPIITMFFLLCYAGVNLSCFLLDLLDAPSWRPRWKWHHFLLSGFGALLCFVIMLIISWIFTIISVILAALIYYYVSVRGKAGDWGDGFKSAYFQLALRSIRTMGAKQVHPKNWYPIPLIYCKPWGILPTDVPCHPMLPDFANCMKKKGRGLSIFVSIMEGEYGERAEEAREATRTLTAYIEYKKCEAVGDVIVARTMEEGFRSLIQSMGIGNLKPNMVCMRYPEIWRDERRQLGNIPNQFVNIIRDCHVGGKAVVIVKGIDDWPGEFQKQYGFIDLYWIIRDGGLMLLLAMLLKSKKSFEGCKIRVFCTAEEEVEAEQLKADVKKFLYDLRMEAEVIVLNYKAMEEEQQAAVDEEHAAERQESQEALRQARKRIAAKAAAHRAEVQSGDTRRAMDGEYKNYDEEKTNQFLYTTMKLNNIILKYSRAAAAVVLVSLPPPPPKHPSYNYMEYMDLLVDQVPRLLMVRGYKRDVVTIYS